MAALSALRFLLAVAESRDPAVYDLSEVDPDNREDVARHAPLLQHMLLYVEDNPANLSCASAGIRTMT